MMDCRWISSGRLVCGIAAGALALAPLAAQAQVDAAGGMAGSASTGDTTATAGGTTGGTGDTTTSGGTTGGGMTGGTDMGGTSSSGMMGSSADMTMSSTPTQVSGTVLRYYVDRSGYVTAMDVQTAEGVRFVRFSPGMGQRLYSTYPVGQTASVWVMAGPGSRWDVVSVGEAAPMGNVPPYRVTDAELLASEPYIMAGAKQVSVTGKLRNLVVGETGEVVGLVLSDATGGTNTSAGMPNPDASGPLPGPAGPVSSDVLVRVSSHFRHIAPGYAGTERVTPLFKGSEVHVIGWPEAPSYGALSTFGQRIAATALVVNGRAVGTIGVPMMTTSQRKALFGGVDIGGADVSAEELAAKRMGYSVYSPSAPGAMMGTEGAPAMTAPEGTAR
jgi:hypothetical protein